MKLKAASRPIAIGDCVLYSGSRASMPNNWCLGRVLWVSKDEALVHRDDGHGGGWRDVVGRDHIRGSGTIAELVDFRRRCHAAIGDLWKAVRDAETALGLARDAVWDALDKMGVSAPPRLKSDLRTASDGIAHAAGIRKPRAGKRRGAA